MGCFNDWLPNPFSKGETVASAYAKFEELLKDWVDAFTSLEASVETLPAEPQERFRKLHDELIGEPRVYGDRLDQIMRALRSMDDVEENLSEAIETQFAKRHWGNLFRLIWSIPCNSSNKIFTPVLCKVLDEGKPHGIAEAAVDALHNIADTRATNSLARTMDHYDPATMTGTSIKRSSAPSR